MVQKYIFLLHGTFMPFKGTKYIASFNINLPSSFLDKPMLFNSFFFNILDKFYQPNVTQADPTIYTAKSKKYIFEGLLASYNDGKGGENK